MSATRRIYPVVRSDLAAAGFSLVAFARWANNDSDGRWHGDVCGCTDDRCVGHHHEEHEECGCFPVVLADALRARRAVVVDETAALEQLHGISTS